MKWIEDRVENLTALMHACNGVMDVELAYAADDRSSCQSCWPALISTFRLKTNPDFTADTQVSAVRSS